MAREAMQNTKFPNQSLTPNIYDIFQEVVHRIGLDVTEGNRTTATVSDGVSGEIRRWRASTSGLCLKARRTLLASTLL
ncbi:hypothetical protein FRC01_004221, partial [Tulasnella sp. 417]